MRSGARAALIVAAALGAGGCADRPPTPATEGPPAAGHAAEGERLETVMRDLDRLSHERLPQALGRRDLWTPRVAEIGRIAESLADSADEIPTAADTRALTPAERREFVGYAAEFGRQARALSRDAETLSPHELDQRLVQLEQACDACHQRFRIPESGEAAAP